MTLPHKHLISAQKLMAQHLREEHGWGIRRISKLLGLTEKELRDFLHAWTEAS